MGIGGDPAVRMLEQQKTAKPAQFVPGIGDDPVFGSPDDGAGGGLDIDAVVMHAAAFAAK